MGYNCISFDIFLWVNTSPEETDSQVQGTLQQGASECGGLSGG